MSENLGRCPLCGGEKQPGTTTFAADLKFGVVVVREVPALVCTKCGDAWIDDPVAAKLENIDLPTRAASIPWWRLLNGNRWRRDSCLAR